MTITEARHKNFGLWSKFVSYTVRHPEIVEGLPRNASLVFGSRSPSLNRYNLKLGRSIRRKERRPVFVAMLSNKRWNVIPLQS